ncbi:AtpZ/AtpI family protein [Croceicoccus mobilis]|uniref:ATP synthase protein I n=1 Tax=Croceicoccus mobilis TaxID=1703339 RepID=A0A917DW42_9SPHN|nr:AtpZ/AtpI family protein [Croceicoccus mobilis]GGD76181.1 hypothetical protein GCM10010990_27290 [Croceicoccus mobilis]
MSEEQSGREPLGEDERIDALDKRLKAAKEREEARNRSQVQGTDENYRMGSRVLADLLGGLVGGTVIGLVIDRFADTAPWGLLVMLGLGIVVAFRNIIRTANRRPD